MQNSGRLTEEYEQQLVEANKIVAQLLLPQLAALPDPSGNLPTSRATASQFFRGYVFGLCDLAMKAAKDAYNYDDSDDGYHLGNIVTSVFAGLYGPENGPSMAELCYSEFEARQIKINEGLGAAVDEFNHYVRTGGEEGSLNAPMALSSFLLTASE